MQQHSLTNPPPCIQLIGKDGKTRDLDLIEAVIVGRCTSAQTKPSNNNGYFDSKVLSRQHAKFYSEQEKVLVMDLGSANGTFLNNKRLSDEGKESTAFEVRDGDVISFGVDILEDGKLMYEKVQFTVSYNSGPIPVTTLESRGASLDKSSSVKQQKVKSASIKNDKLAAKPELPAKPNENLVYAVQQGVARVQEQTQEIAKIQSQLQVLNEPKQETKFIEFQSQYQQDVSASNKKIIAVEQSTLKLTHAIDQLSLKLLQENENLKKEQTSLYAQLLAIQKSNAEILNKLEGIRTDTQNRSSRKVFKFLI